MLTVTIPLDHTTVLAVMNTLGMVTAVLIRLVKKNAPLIMIKKYYKIEIEKTEL